METELLKCYVYTYIAIYHPDTKLTIMLIIKNKSLAGPNLRPLVLVVELSINTPHDLNLIIKNSTLYTITP